jgi:hypothetical protein
LMFAGILSKWFQDNFNDIIELKLSGISNIP